MDRNQDKEATVLLSKAVSQAETQTHNDIMMQIMQREMNGNKRAGTASNKELVDKVEGLYI